MLFYYSILLNIYSGQSVPTNKSPISWYRWSIDFARWPAQEAKKQFSEPGKTLMLCIYCWLFRALPKGNEGGLLMGDSFLVIQIHLHSSQFCLNSSRLSGTLSHFLATGLGETLPD